MTTTTMARKAARFARAYDMIVTRRRKLLGFGGLDELILVGLWDDARGRRRRTELVRLGTAQFDRHGAEARRDRDGPAPRGHAPAPALS
jgi:hypothetical protein